MSGHATVEIGSSRGFAAGGAGLRWGRFGQSREPDGHGRAGVDGAVHGDRAAMHLDDLADRGRAAADAEVLGREQRREDARQYVRRYARAGIDDAEADMGAGAFTTDGDAAPMTGRRTPGRIVQRLGGVVDEIDDDLPNCSASIATWATPRTLVVMPANADTRRPAFMDSGFRACERIVEAAIESAAWRLCVLRDAPCGRSSG